MKTAAQHLSILLRPRQEPAVQSVQGTSPHCIAKEDLVITVGILILPATHITRIPYLGRHFVIKKEKKLFPNANKKAEVY